MEGPGTFCAFCGDLETFPPCGIEAAASVRGIFGPGLLSCRGTFGPGTFGPGLCCRGTLGPGLCCLVTTDPGVATSDHLIPLIFTSLFLAGTFLISSSSIPLLRNSFCRVFAQIDSIRSGKSRHAGLLHSSSMVAPQTLKRSPTVMQISVGLWFSKVSDG